ncbi:GNAT family acetyltransferase [Loigolactobacillus backii]|uniref:GNAT family acetyltransferase n=1 Tax=Loigolactobacillus backii TaxID=375175 RepID=A0A192GZQ0_9LACO|nr:GNAT family N-acetyltransferase [Loigolactobacillus backii]ANK61513.1 GNAT family acetyltransferase [Loigolactobacillus backii]ANK69289.1 GNAT family acetyltransferase [Loigolactobacillus backii]
MIIREAQKDDAGQIAPLINLIYDEMQLEELEDVPDGDLLKVIRAAYQTDAYLSGKATTVVAEINHRIVGVAFGYPDENEDAVDAVMTRLSAKNAAFAVEPLELESEIFTDEWYLDSIAVDPNYQGHGIGGKLLKALPNYVQRDDMTTIGLNVDFANPSAKKLYQRFDYETVGTKLIGDHKYYHMQLDLEPTKAVMAS